jgi:hypothetical protein
MTLEVLELFFVVLTLFVVAGFGGAMLTLLVLDDGLRVL